MRDELRGIQKRLGITSLYVTHDQSGDGDFRYRCHHEGRKISCRWDNLRIFTNIPLNQFVADFIGKANFIPCIFKGMQNKNAIVTYGGHRYTIPNPGDISRLSSRNPV